MTALGLVVPVDWRVMVEREDGWETIYRGPSRSDARAVRLRDGSPRARIERVDPIVPRRRS